MLYRIFSKKLVHALRDKVMLNELWDANKAPWKSW